MNIKNENINKNINKKIKINRNIKNIILVIIKMLFLLIFVLFTFLFVFGILRYQNLGMNREISPSDLVMYFRLNKRYKKGDLVVLNIKTNIVSLEERKRKSKEEEEEKEKKEEKYKENEKAKKSYYEIYRVIAEEGDEVDIKEDKVIVNGLIQEEEYAIGNTKAFEEGIKFPVKVKKGSVFLLADNREKGIDSRIFGNVLKKDILGKVILVFKKY